MDHSEPQERLWPDATVHNKITRENLNQVQPDLVEFQPIESLNNKAQNKLAIDTEFSKQNVSNDLPKKRTNIVKVQTPKIKVAHADEEVIPIPTKKNAINPIEIQVSDNIGKNKDHKREFKTTKTFYGAASY